MQHHIVSSRWFAFAGAWAILACSSAEPNSSPETGSARFELETGTESGDVFRLVDAVFELTGPQPTAVTSDGIGPWVQVDVMAGDYGILLKDGWSLRHISGPGEQIYTGDAVLVSDNPLFVTLPLGQVTDVIFKFSLDGDVLGKGEARGRIGISVDVPSCGNGVFDPGEECDSAISYAGAVCDNLCTGGYKPCSEGVDCASGICERGDCGCDTSADACHERCADDNSECGTTCANAAEECSGDCASGEDSCRDTCGALSRACWLTCFPDPISCAATCEPPRTLCLNACTNGRNSCDDGCDDGFTECTAPCNVDACHTDCDETEETCVGGCNRCESCTSAGQCPYLEQ